MGPGLDWIFFSERRMRMDTKIQRSIRRKALVHGHCLPFTIYKPIILEITRRTPLQRILDLEDMRVAKPMKCSWQLLC